MKIVHKCSKFIEVLVNLKSKGVSFPYLNAKAVYACDYFIKILYLV